MMLTNSKSDGTWSVIGSDGEEIPWKDIPNELYGAICKLRDYEKTGLSPDTIAITRDENKRLCEGILQLNKRVDELESVLKGSGNNG